MITRTAGSLALVLATLAIPSSGARAGVNDPVLTERAAAERWAAELGAEVATAIFTARTALVDARWPLHLAAEALGKQPAEAVLRVAFPANGNRGRVVIEVPAKDPSRTVSPAEVFLVYQPRAEPHRRDADTPLRGQGGNPTMRVPLWGQPGGANVVAGLALDRWLGLRDDWVERGKPANRVEISVLGRRDSQVYSLNRPGDLGRALISAVALVDRVPERSEGAASPGRKRRRR